MNLPEIKKLAEKRLYRLPKVGFYQFFCKAWTIFESDPLEPTLHMRYLCEVAQDEIERIVAKKPRQKHITISVPPRTAKSSIFSIALNAWAWSFAPHLRIMSISATQRLSAKMSLKTRRLISSRWYQGLYGDVFKLSKDKNTGTEFWNDKNGVRFATSATGTITGDGADIVITDDLVSATDARSKVALEAGNTTYKETIYNRLNNPLVGLHIVIAQRLAAGDVIGMIYERYKDEFTSICLPAELTNEVYPPDCTRLYTDGLLSPTRMPYSYLATLSEDPQYYSAQYLQNPIAGSGNLFDVNDIQDFSLQELVSHAAGDGIDLVWYASVDGALTDKSKSDYTAALVWTVYRNRLFIRDVFFGKILPTQYDQLAKFLVKNRIDSRGVVFVEPKASGHAVIDILVTTFGINATESFNPINSKQERASEVVRFFSSKRVCLATTASNRQMYIDQLAAFPYSSKDDGVDATIIAIKHGLMDGIKNKISPLNIIEIKPSTLGTHLTISILKDRYYYTISQRINGRNYFVCCGSDVNLSLLISKCIEQSKTYGGVTSFCYFGDNRREISLSINKSIPTAKNLTTNPRGDASLFAVSIRDLPKSYFKKELTELITAVNTMEACDYDKNGYSLCFCGTSIAFL